MKPLYKHEGFFFSIKIGMKKYFVYVIELDQSVAQLNRFRKKNPKYLKGNCCVYVGQSSRKPALRFEQHKDCLLYTSPSPRDVEESRMPSSA